MELDLKCFFSHRRCKVVCCGFETDTAVMASSDCLCALRTFVFICVTRVTSPCRPSMHWVINNTGVTGWLDVWAHRSTATALYTVFICSFTGYEMNKRHVFHQISPVSIHRRASIPEELKLYLLVQHFVGFVSLVTHRLTHYPATQRTERETVNRGFVK